MTIDWQFRVGGTEDIDRVEPLWLAVHHHHAASMSELAPYVSDAQSWRVHQAMYEELLAKPDTLLLLAWGDEALAGYGFTHVVAVEDTFIPDTWATGPRIGEIESLSVLPQYRGHGLGSRILDRLEAHLRDRGVDDVVLGALAGNRDAIRLYQRHGYQPTYLYLSRLHGRRGSGSAVV